MQAEIVQRNPLVIVPKTEAAAKWFGKGTKWCTAADKDNMFDYYNKRGLLYIVFWNGKKYQLHFESMQFMDERDQKIEHSLLIELRRQLSALFKTGENSIKKDLWSAYWYAHGVLKQRWPEGEDVIKKDPRSAYIYAADVVKQRWPEGEDVIKKDPDWWSKYQKLIRSLE